MVELDLQIKSPQRGLIQSVDEIGRCDQDARKALQLRQELVDLAHLPTVLGTAAVLQLLHQTIVRANSLGRNVCVCGEMAGDAAFTDLLLAMGLRSFSMHPARIASIKQRILRADIRQLEGHVAQVLASDAPAEAMRALAHARATY